MLRDQRNEFPRPLFCFLDRSRYLFIQVAPQLSSRGWVDPVPDPLLLKKSGRVGNRTRDFWICSHKLWPLDHRGGQEIEVLAKTSGYMDRLATETEITSWGYRVFNRTGNGTCSLEQMERFSETTVPFSASESAVASLIPSNQFLYMHTFIRIP
jgi:hypothetical protein